jgi:uncharacterized membrane protein YeaQ/YmgE (transglycosylase-associated protein family)
MTKRLMVVRGLLGFAAVFVPGAVGAVVVAKTLSTYWGHDQQASVIVAAIGVALLLGSCERHAWRSRCAPCLPYPTSRRSMS